MNPIALNALNYSFDYSQFQSPDLQTKAQATLSNFIGFVRRTFDGLLESGRALQSIYNDCIKTCPDGKKLFEQWLASADFGASRYIASCAISIYVWFEKQDIRVQRLVREKVQNWSVAALHQLTKVSNDLVKELVCDGKKTAQQIKAATQAGGEKTKKKTSGLTPLAQSSPIELGLGVRIIVVEDDSGWKGSSGIITGNWEQNGTTSWWVLLDHTIVQGMDSKHLFKTYQIQPEVLQVQKKVNEPASGEMFSQSDLEERIAEALVQRDKEKSLELEALRQQTQQATKYQEELAQKLADKERELQKLEALAAENQQLKQRIAELENTYKFQMSEVAADKNIVENIKQLQITVELKEQQIDTLKHLSRLQEETLSKILSETAQNQNKLHSLIRSLGDILGNKVGIGSWSKYGYRATNGERYCGLEALEMFSKEAEDIFAAMIAYN